MKNCILVIDDSNLMRGMICRALKKEIQDIETVECSDGKEAVNSMTKKVYNIIITDLEMIGMDGNDFTSKLKSNPLLSKKNIIFYTSKPEGVRDQLKEKSGVYVLDKSKTDSLKDLVGLVNKLLGNASNTER